MTALAADCYVAALEAQMAALARGRSYEKHVAITAHMESAEFQSAAAALEPRVRAGIAMGRPVLLREIAAALGVPPDIAVNWLVDRLGIPAEIALGSSADA
jgi:hypothetical protein